MQCSALVSKFRAADAGGTAAAAAHWPGAKGRDTLLTGGRLVYVEQGLGAGGKGVG